MFILQLWTWTTGEKAPKFQAYTIKSLNGSIKETQLSNFLFLSFASRTHIQIGSKMFGTQYSLFQGILLKVTNTLVYIKNN